MTEFPKPQKAIFNFIFYKLKKILSREIRRTIFSICFFIFLFFFSAINAEAAILYLEFSEKEYYREDIFMVELKLDTEGEKINVLKAELTFPYDKLEVVDISRGDSVLTLWPKEPVFSNEQGKISFTGGVPLGFEGRGKIISIPFRVISSQESET